MRSGTSLKEAIGIIIVADVVMSLDNVIAIAAAAQGDLVLVILACCFRCRWSYGEAEFWPAL